MKFKDLFAIFKTFYGYFVVSQIHFEQYLKESSEICRRVRVRTQLSVGDVIISRTNQNVFERKEFYKL